MRRDLFLRIVDAVKDHDNFSYKKKNCTGRHGLSTLQKVTVVFRMMAYGASTDSTDEYVRIGESTAILCMKIFCSAIVEIFGNVFLRSSNANDTERLLSKSEKRGFPGMLGSLDCMHWEWKNCPTTWAGQYSGRHGHLSIILEKIRIFERKVKW